MEATIQYDLHAPIDFRSSDVSFINFHRHTRMDTRLKLLSGEVTPGERQSTTDVPRDERYSKGSYWFVETRLFSEQCLEKLDRRPVVMHQ